jgi:hypothetical protein
MKKCAKELLRKSLRGFAVKSKVNAIKRDALVKEQLKKLRLDVAMKKIRKFWQDKKLSFEEMMKNVRSYKIRAAEEESIVILVTDENQEIKTEKKKESGLTRKKSIRKKGFSGLPAISTTPVNKQKGSFNLNPKRATSQNRMSKSVASRKVVEKLPVLHKAYGN